MSDDNITVWHIACANWRQGGGWDDPENDHTTATIRFGKNKILAASQARHIIEINGCFCGGAVGRIRRGDEVPA